MYCQEAIQQAISTHENFVSATRKSSVGIISHFNVSITDNKFQVTLPPFPICHHKSKKRVNNNVSEKQANISNPISRQNEGTFVCQNKRQMQYLRCPFQKLDFLFCSHRTPEKQRRRKHQKKPLVGSFVRPSFKMSHYMKMVG